MRIATITMNISVNNDNALEQVKANMASIAKANDLSIADLLDQAKASNGNGPAYLNRALALQKRIEKLSQE